jgi:hypothetical protein
MTLQEIVDYARYKLDNYEVPYLWTDKELVIYCNETIDEMCRDAYVLEDSKTISVCEIHTVANTFDYALAASVLAVRSAKIVTQELLTLDTAPATAWAADDTLTGATSGKTCIVVEKLTDYTYVVEKRNGTFTLGEVISNGTYTADQSSTYPIFSDYKSSELTKTDYNEMSRFREGWRTATASEPTKYLTDFSEGYISVYPKPDITYVLRLSVYRYPVTEMNTTASLSSQTPEINAKYHNTLVYGMCAKAYLKNGENTYDEKKAATYLNLYRKGMMDIKIKNIKLKGITRVFSPQGGFI